MRSFSEVFKDTIEIVSLADEAVVQKDEVYANGFDEAWENYQKTLDRDLLVFDEEPILFEMRVVRSEDAEREISKAKNKLSQTKNTADQATLTECCRKVLEHTLVHVKNVDGFPDMSEPEQRKKGIDALLAHGHGLSLFMTLQQYESRGIKAASNVKKN